MAAVYLTSRSPGASDKKVSYRSKNHINEYDLTLDHWLIKFANWQMSLIPIGAHIPTYSGHSFVPS
jgi:hypothetical protein